jgi:hypothetical protein
VFDGRPLRGDVPEQRLGGVEVRVPSPGRDADSVIRELVERAARPAELTVVTSDKPLYSYCRTLGAGVLRAHEWNALERRAHLRSPRPGPGVAASASDKPDREVDVEGWLGVFGVR